MMLGNPADLEPKLFGEDGVVDGFGQIVGGGDSRA
jgi:hypothetical protein